MMMLSVTWGRDYRTTTRYEFIVYRGEEVVLRKGFFTTSNAAKKAGIEAAKTLAEAATS